MNRKITLDEHRLWIALRQTFSLISELEDGISKGHGISSQQFNVLWLMEIMSNVIEKQIIITDLAPPLYRSVYSVSTIIDRMEKKGLIEKTRSSTDRRSIYVSLTQKGHEKYLEVVKSYRDAIVRILSDYSDEDIQTFLSNLKILETRMLAEPNVGKLSVNPSIRNGQEIVNFINDTAKNTKEKKTK